MPICQISEPPERYSLLIIRQLSPISIRWAVGRPRQQAEKEYTARLDLFRLPDKTESLEVLNRVKPVKALLL